MCYVILRSANHTVIRVVNTTQCHIGVVCIHLLFFTVHCKNVVCYVTLHANHTVIRVVNTMQCHMIHQLVWYAHCIFTVYRGMFYKQPAEVKMQRETLSDMHGLARQTKIFRVGQKFLT